MRAIKEHWHWQSQQLAEAHLGQSSMPLSCIGSALGWSLRLLKPSAASLRARKQASLPSQCQPLHARLAESCQWAGSLRACSSTLPSERERHLPAACIIQAPLLRFRYEPEQPEQRQLAGGALRVLSARAALSLLSSAAMAHSGWCCSSKTYARPPSACLALNAAWLGSLLAIPSIMIPLASPLLQKRYGNPAS